MQKKEFLALTSTNGSPQLVNMLLVSEVLSAISTESQYTNLVIPSAVHEDARYIAVKETPEQIMKILADSQSSNIGIDLPAPMPWTIETSISSSRKPVMFVRITASNGYEVASWCTESKDEHESYIKTARFIIKAVEAFKKAY